MINYSPIGIVTNRSLSSECTLVIQGHQFQMGSCVEQFSPIKSSFVNWVLSRKKTLRVENLKRRGIQLVEDVVFVCLQIKILNIYFCNVSLLNPPGFIYATEEDYCGILSKLFLNVFLPGIAIVYHKEGTFCGADLVMQFSGQCGPKET